ncbi:MAG: hypothetical protein ABFR97_07650 [Thermodesulfobacteriota bacterium]
MKVALIFTLAACAPQKRVPLPVRPQPPYDAMEAQPGLAPEDGSATSLMICKGGTGFLELRLGHYDRLRGKWQELGDKFAAQGLPLSREWQTCRLEVERLAQGYHNLSMGSGAEADFLSLVKRDVSFRERGCPGFYERQVALLPPTTVDGSQDQLTRQAGDNIRSFAKSGHLDDLIAACENYEQVSGGEMTDPELLLIHGHALLQKGLFQEAVAVLDRAVAVDPTNNQLRLEVPQLFIAAGDYFVAQERYLELADHFQECADYSRTVSEQLALLFASGEHRRELGMYRQVLATYLVAPGDEIPAETSRQVAALQQDFGGTIYASEARRLYVLLVDKVRQQTALTLVEVEMLVGQNQYAKANQALAELRSRNLPEDVMAQVVKTHEALFTAQGERQKPGLQSEQDVEDAWQEGVNLRDMRLYDKAIAVFEGLLGTSYSARAAAEIDAIADLAAFDLRKKAARLFGKAKRTSDPSRRLELFKQSRVLLEEIMAKYPQAKIVPKVRRNLASIDKQIAETQGLVGDDGGPGVN